MARPEYLLFDRDTKAIFWNLNRNAIQRMLDYDYLVGRSPSIVAIVAPTQSRKFDKFFYGTEEIMIPIYRSTTEAAEAHPEADVLVNFASFRTAYDVAREALNIPTIRTIAITAEGIPERLARDMAARAKQEGKWIIGPATVGGIAAGAFRIGNAGGTLENIVKSKLHRPGSCGLVTRSGGLFNELSNIIARNADGIVEGIAIGGDRFPGSDFLDHLLRFQKNPAVKYMVMLGEVGGELEYMVVEALEKGLITKPLIAWCIGTIAKHFGGEVQFGHAGAKAGADRETADAKNRALREAGALVPESFNDIPDLIRKVYEDLKAKGEIGEIEEPEVPPIPEDYDKARRAGKVRRPTHFICTISDDRGEEATYCGVPISEVVEKGYSIADVIGLLWFKRKFPKWASDFIDMVIKIVADHGPAVSGAHNAKVTARAGKDLISSLVTGLLTIGPRFGGAIDGAAKYFKMAKEKGMDPFEFVEYMKKVEKKPIPGIGHRIKSTKNPDKRVELLKNYAKENFPSTELLDYALEVEKVTTAKKENLILNVDGTIGVLLVDMFRSLGFSEAEIDELIEAGAFNAFFVLGRSIGFIGHILDEKRLAMPLYRHPWDDILYDVKRPEGV
ncbi:ATP-citrate lyase/succinyl-CoA ligase [Thermovibrio ammonificans HB-1]|uniref:ATP-citrate lyase/succinyl-CoA ligase n=1 Tax=Thermovibrio ammonificans (strain DSM 15698 / JCM 12110 / HB-1) TaxID=648996 RepID=E8T293_THEA1|nr:citrate/2-methylcitrate synthase [Thermovibrio ammonificans]ADU96988.1 ATP-citrate lyase/succinyl-CoA ligase [Thermovibrio ammonificans HB-1]